MPISSIMLTSSLYTAYSGLMAASKGITTTSNNIANAATPNYTAQNLVFETMLPYGVQTLGPVENRNTGLYKLISKTTSSETFSQTLSDITSNMDALVNVSEGSTYKSIQDLRVALYDLGNATPATQESYKSAVYYAASALVDTFHNKDEQLVSQSDALKQNNVNLLNTANGLISDIAELNKEIPSTFDLSSKSQLIDTRQTKIEDLSKLMDISINYESNDQVTVYTNQNVLVNTDNKTLLNSYVGIVGGKIGANNTAITTVIPKQLAALDTMASDVSTVVNGTLKQNIFSGSGSSDVGFASAISLLVNAPSSITTNFNPGQLNTDLNGIENFASQNYADLGNFENSLLSSASSTATQLQGLNAYRQDTEGVSLENEAINLERFKTAYEANAKVVSVVNDMYQTTLDMLA